MDRRNAVAANVAAGEDDVVADAAAAAEAKAEIARVARKTACQELPAQKATGQKTRLARRAHRSRRVTVAIIITMTPGTRRARANSRTHRQTIRQAKDQTMRRAMASRVPAKLVSSRNSGRPRPSTGSPRSPNSASRRRHPPLKM
jgi:hypothetical protein